MALGGPTLGQAGTGFVTLYNALGGGGGASAGGASGAQATGSQQTAAAHAAGLSGGFGKYSAAGQAQQQGAELQNKAMSQQIKQRQQILDMLLGQFGGQGGAGGQSGGSSVQSLLDQMTNVGQGTRNVINENFQNLQNSTMARFTQYGMGGSSGVPSVLSGIERQKALAVGELDDQLLSQKIGVQERGMDRALQLQQVLAGLL